MPLPRLLITGASGFVGRHLVAEVKQRYRIIGIGRRSQHEAGIPPHPNISWFQLDIGDQERLAEAFGSIKRDGGADVLLHLAVYYDLSGEEHPEYRRTNVEGLRNVLELSRDLGLRRFVFASSVAACRFPRPGNLVNEQSTPDGEHPFAISKRLGEAMLEGYRSSFPSAIVRFAALYSDWCEHPPLFMLLRSWLSGAWNARILGGRGESAVPYLHIDDATSFLTTLLTKLDALESGEVLLASPDEPVSHRELFAAATGAHFGAPRRPIHLPKPLCRPAMATRLLIARLLGHEPFERPWMARYIDQRLVVDASRTRARLDWAPRQRLELLHRLPLLLNNLRIDPIEWNRRNRVAMKFEAVRTNLLIHRLLVIREREIRETFMAHILAPDNLGLRASYRRIGLEELDWHLSLSLRHLGNAIMTGERAVFFGYCRDLARRRHTQGFSCEELCYALVRLAEVCVRVLRSDPASAAIESELEDHITMTVQFGIDQVRDVYDRLGPPRPSPRPCSEIDLWLRHGQH